MHVLDVLVLVAEDVAIAAKPIVQQDVQVLARELVEATVFTHAVVAVQAAVATLVGATVLKTVPEAWA